MNKLLLFISLTFCLLNVELATAQIPSYVPTNGLVGYWPFNGNANDESGNGNNGTVNGATLTTDRFGNAGKAYDFSGGSDYATLPSATTSTITKTMSVSLWAKHNNPNSTGFIFDKAAVPGYYDKATLLQWGIDLRLYNENSFYNTFQNVQDTNWHQYVAIWKDTAVTLFIDGILKGTGILGNSFSNTPGIITLGKMNGYAPDNYSGKIDDIGIYNRALTQSEITGLYNAGTNTCLPSYLPTTGLVGYWPFCGNANDESGNGNNGTVNGATLTTDRFGNVGKAYHFDGQTNNITIPNNNLFNFQSSNKFSVSYWMKADSLSSSKISVILSKQTGLGTTQDGWNAGVELNYQPTLRLQNGSAASLGTIGGSVSQANAYYQVCFTYDNGLMNVFVNGQLANQQTASGSILGDNVSNLLIGKASWVYSNTKGFSGTIDDIALYNRALTATEVQNLYNASAPTTCIANIINNDTTICSGQSVTLNADAVASGSVTDINGNVYPTVNIGTQTWMQKNLNVSKYKNGDIIPQVTDATQWANLTTGAWCWYNNDSATYAATYGKLYNWYAVNDTRGLAPEGWHVPSNSEWNKLEKYIDINSDTNCINCIQSLIIGGILKESGTLHWTSPNSGAIDSYAFTSLPAGYRNNSGNYLNVRNISDYWCSDLYNATTVQYINLRYQDNYLYKTSIEKSYGFSVRTVRNTPTFLWSTGATTPSITVSPTATTTYYLTVTDANGNICRDSVKVTVNTAVPATPGSITGATDVCPSFASTTSASSNAVTYSIAAMSTATSYTWTVPAGVTIVSGQGTNSISVSFASTFLSGVISVKANNACGSSTAARSLSVYKRVAATPGTIQKSFVPSTVAVTSVCGLVSETYMIRKVSYATSYNWSLALGTNATITHLNPLGANDTAVRVNFASGFVRDTIRVTAQTACSVSALRTLVLNATLAPPAVSALTSVGGNFTVCIGSSITLTALSTIPTASQSAIQYFRWTKPANTTIAAANADSSRITLSINAGFTGGSVSVKAASACGFFGAAKSVTLQYLPVTPSAISSATGSFNACIGNTISYSVLVGQGTSSQSIASVFRWTRPANTSIISATADSSTITLQFNAGFTGGNLTVRGQSSCGTQGGLFTQALTHAGCPAGTKVVPYATNENANTKLDAQLFPNPTTSAFNLKVSSGSQLPVVIKLRDAEGRLLKSFTTKAGALSNFGNDLQPGVYMVEVLQGEERKVVRGVRM